MNMKQKMAKLRARKKMAGGGMAMKKKKGYARGGAVRRK